MFRRDETNRAYINNSHENNLKRETKSRDKLDKEGKWVFVYHSRHESENEKLEK